ncbi:MAG: holin [Phycicoccus sp.]
MFTALFWRDATERALATAAQSTLAAWAVGDGLLNAFVVDWPTAGGIALGGAVLSLLKSVAATRVGDRESASLSPSVGIEQRLPRSS